MLQSDAGGGRHSSSGEEESGAGVAKRKAAAFVGDEESSDEEDSGAGVPNCPPPRLEDSSDEGSSDEEGRRAGELSYEDITLNYVLRSREVQTIQEVTGNKVHFNMTPTPAFKNYITTEGGGKLPLIDSNALRIAFKCVYESACFGVSMLHESGTCACVLCYYHGYWLQRMNNKLHDTKKKNGDPECSSTPLMVWCLTRANPGRTCQALCPDQTPCSVVSIRPITISARSSPGTGYQANIRIGRRLG